MNKTNSINGLNSIDISDSVYNNEDSEKRNRATKNWKKVKEISKKEDKRPPWQMPSLSTLPKADTNSLLKAKLLDASRRLRAGKSSASTQTDFDAKASVLMKEVNTDVQYDLVSKSDAESLTDGAISMRPDGPGEFVFTHTIAQMTDGIVYINMCTQTATPRISSFPIDRKPSSNSNEKEFLLFLNKKEELLLAQSREIKEIDKLLDRVNSSDNLLLNVKNRKHINVMPTTINKKNKRALGPTISFWSYDIIGETVAFNNVIKDNPLSLTSTMNVEKKLANMTLAPTTLKKPQAKNTNLMMCNNNQYNAILNLVQEANEMISIFEEISSFLGPNIFLNELPTRDSTQVTFLSKHWNPILDNLQTNIKTKIASLRKPDLKVATKIGLDIIF